MNRKNYFLHSLALIWVLVFGVSCREFSDDILPIEPEIPGTPVVAGVLLRIVDERSADGSVIPITRAPLDTNEDKIYNVWVFQFDGSDDNATLICPPYYIDEEAIAEAEAASIDGKTVLPMPLIDSKNATHRLVFVANINDRSYGWNLQIGQGTFADLKSRYLHLSNEALTYGADRKNLVMSGSVLTPVNPDVLVDGDSNPESGAGEGVPMIRSLACIELNLSVDGDKAPGFRVVKVQLRNVSTRFDYFDALLGIGDGVNYPAVATNLDYTVDSDFETGLVTAGSTKSYSWYVPRNARGTGSGSVSELTKNAYAFIGSTFIEITAENDNGKGVFYRIYPGANDVDDFNILPNHKYTISLNITGDGGPNSVDSRIESFGDVMFVGNSNCYMLNPPEEGLQAREFSIPVSQVNRYWLPSYTGYGGQLQNILESTDKWVIDLLWQDASGIVRDASDGSYDPARHITISKAEGRGGDDHFTIKVPSGAAHGNFVVILREEAIDGVLSDVLWSWHLWVTNYNPNPRYVAIRNNQFIYPVTGGHVDRYFGTRFGYSTSNSATGDINSYSPTVTATASLARSVVMDRNIGAFNTAYSGSSGRGSMFYQFGRKDPFPGSVTLYRIDGSAITNIPTGTIPQQIWTNMANCTPAVPLIDNQQILFSIKNPMVFMGSSWQGIADASVGWNDPLSTDKMNYQTKSIYDPCPEGWRMMPSDAMDDFRYGSDNFPTVGDPGRNLPYYSRTSHRYYPYVMENGVDYATSMYMLFPPNGQRNAGTGGFHSTVGTTSFLWFASPMAANTGQNKAIGGTGGSETEVGTINSLTTQNGSRPVGNNVRCVSE